MKTAKEIVSDQILPNDLPMIRFFDTALWCAKNLDNDAAFVETGTRSGHASILMLRAVKESGKDRWVFTIDPYGDKPYGLARTVSTDFDYGEQHYRNALHSLSAYAYEHDLLHHHYRLRSQEFAFLKENTEFWYKGDKIEPKYGFVYLDGEHTIGAINKELEYFLPRLVDGGWVVVDDVHLIKEDLDSLLIKGEEYEGKLWFQKCA